MLKQLSRLLAQRHHRPQLSSTGTTGISELSYGRERSSPILVGECRSAPDLSQLHDTVSTVGLGFHVTFETAQEMLEEQAMGETQGLAEMRHHAAACDGARTSLDIRRYLTAQPSRPLTLPAHLEAWSQEVQFLGFGNIDGERFLVPNTRHADVLEARFAPAFKGTHFRCQLPARPSAEIDSPLKSLLRSASICRNEFWMWVTLIPTRDNSNGRLMWRACIDLWFPNHLYIAQFAYWFWDRGYAIEELSRREASYPPNEKEMPVHESEFVSQWVNDLYPFSLLALKGRQNDRTSTNFAGPIVYNVLSEPSVLAAHHLHPFRMNGAIIGLPGTGKHYLANALVFHHVAGGNPAWIFQADETQVEAYRAAGFRVVDAEHGLNPLADRKYAAESPDVLASWILAIAEEVPRNDCTHGILQSAIRHLASTDEQLSLSAVLSYTRVLCEHFVDDPSELLAKKLQPFLEDGEFEHLFNGQALDLGNSRLTVFPAYNAGIPQSLRARRDLSIALLVDQQWRRQSNAAATPKLAYMRGEAADPGPYGQEVWSWILRRSRRANGAWLHRINYDNVAAQREWITRLMYDVGWSAVTQLPPHADAPGVSQATALMASTIATIPYRQSQFVYQGEYPRVGVDQRGIFTFPTRTIAYTYEMPTKNLPEGRLSLR
ncbi:hypothetical protein ACOTC5_31180 [Achromobacter xylosoxidans]